MCAQTLHTYTHTHTHIHTHAYTYAHARHTHTCISILTHTYIRTTATVTTFMLMPDYSVAGDYIRLVDGNSPEEGRVEVYHNGE